MGGINVFILRRDFTIAKKNIDSKASHVHFGSGSYLNMANGILTTPNYKESPMLIFQEGNAVPKGVASVATVSTEAENQQKTQNPLENVKWGTWYIPMLRGLNRQHHGRFSMNLKELFNLKTLPFWIIGFAVLAQLLGG